MFCYKNSSTSFNPVLPAVATFLRTVFNKEISNNYPLECRISSVNLTESSNQPISQTARDLDISHNTLHNWISRYSDSNKNNQKNMSGNADSFEEVKSLKKELTMVKQERDLLKKAAAKFAKGSR
jgi:transposase